jgi:hypothetical protein
MVTESQLDEFVEAIRNGADLAIVLDRGVGTGEPRGEHLSHQQGDQ